MLAGLKGLEEVADRWEEGIGRTEDLRTSHTLDALSVDLKGSGARMFGGLWRPVPPCATQPRRIRSPYILRFQILEA